MSCKVGDIVRIDDGCYVLLQEPPEDVRGPNVAYGIVVHDPYEHYLVTKRGNRKLHTKQGDQGWLPIPIVEEVIARH